MLVFQVKDMTCGHCVATLTKALNAADPNATVDISAQERPVRVQPAHTGATGHQSRLEKTGSPRPTPPAGSSTATPPAPDAPGMPDAKVAVTVPRSAPPSLSRKVAKTGPVRFPTVKVKARETVAPPGSMIP